tara:strand:- start:6575 stop:6757 length:183 start_codon:yes stop_codon:yes gene_type:complete
MPSAKKSYSREEVKQLIKQLEKQLDDMMLPDPPKKPTKKARGGAITRSTAKRPVRRTTKK